MNGSVGGWSTTPSTCSRSSPRPEAPRHDPPRDPRRLSWPLSVVWRWFRRLVLIYLTAFAVGYLGVTWWLHQHPEHVTTPPPTEVAQ